MIKGIRGKKTRMKTNLFQPLSILNFEFYSKPNRELDIVKEVSISTSLNFPYDMNKSSQAMFMAEFLSRALVQEERDDKMFHFIVNSLEYFDLETKFNPNFHLAFISKATRFLGILPDMENESNSQVFNIREGSFDRTIPFHIEFMDTKSSGIFLKLLRLNYDECNKIKLKREERNSLLKEILKFYSFYHFNMAQLKSVDVLKEVFR